MKGNLFVFVHSETMTSVRWFPHLYGISLPFLSMIDCDSSFKAIPVDISNMIESPQEDYQSFQSNLASGVSRYNFDVSRQLQSESTI